MTPTEPTVYTDSARKGNGCVIVLDAPASRNVSGYQETAISADASEGWNDPSVPAKIRKMLSMYDYGDGSFKQKCLNFYRQGKFMEDYEDDFPWEGEFRRYFPTYHDLNIPQLRGYFTWRTRLRKGEHLPIATSLAYLYLYELLNGIGTSSVEESLWRMQEFETEFLETGICDPHIQYNLHRWMTELAIIHQLPKSMVLQYTSPRTFEMDRSMEILQTYENRTDEEIFQALCRFTDQKIETSPVIRADAVTGKHLFAEVWRFASARYLHEGKDLFTTCFGHLYEYNWNPLDNAVYLEQRNLPEITYKLNNCHQYLYKNGYWGEAKYEDCKRIKSMLHVTDLMLRRYLKKAPYLREKPEEAWAVPYVEAVIEADRQAKIEAARPKINIDLSHLVQIRADAAITRNSLLTEEELAETDEGPKNEEVAVNKEFATNQNTFGLDSLHWTILATLIAGKPADELLKTHRLMPSIVTDTINEAFFDEIGDNILECDGERISLVEDYIEDVQLLVGH